MIAKISSKLWILAFLPAASMCAQDVLDVPPVFALRGAVTAGRSFLGVGVAEVDNNRARDLKLNDVHGVEVTRVEEDSAASKAGIKVGDVVLEYNGQRVEGIEQFIRLVHETPAGRVVKLLISRNGATQVLPVAMGVRKGNFAMTVPEIQVPTPDMPHVFTTMSSARLGIEAEALTPQLGEFFGVKQGVLVRSIVKDSAAEKAGIKAGDVITRIDQTNVATPGELSSAVRAARSQKTFPVELMRDKRSMILNVTMEDAEKEQLPRVRSRSIKM
jgi:serine protease Do